MTILSYLRTNGIRHTLEVIYRHKIDNFFKLVINKITSNNLSNIIVIEGHNDFDSNGGAIYNYLIKNGYNKDYKIVWLLKNKLTKKLPSNVTYCYLNKPSVRKNYFLCKAKYILTCNNAIGSIKKDQVSIYMTHGPVSLKAVKGIATLPSNLRYCFMPSDYLKPILIDQYGIGSGTKTIELGYPMHDILYTKEKGDLSKITTYNYNKVILWMPTFRKSWFGRNDSLAEFPLGIPIFRDLTELETLNRRLLSDDSLLIIKIHPMQDLSTINIPEKFSNIKIIDGNYVQKNNIDNYRLMKDVNALISDYSSSAYDFLHLDRPIAFTMDDFNSYKLDYIVDNPLELMCGNKINNISDFLSFVEYVISDKDDFSMERRRVFNKLFKFHDGNSSRRLVEFMGIHNMGQRN
ncbi:CDP-glycerol glycerophosphotransferase family protein [Ligilactobacillus agilis]|uniref:CDP-glycerol glycerophosphotransferase family protein n=1 Tax=Ligilactobacillus agilis TaxID=1601 RepID=UPI001437629D|nr:CDP-glycerol glycerophosphotransferase family protein [Ligilactobacillus agilis]GET15715.1 putative glycerol phosphotransferase [Ligilactobacillus agilis]